jgi:hypothetical protein
MLKGRGLTASILAPNNGGDSSDCGPMEAVFQVGSTSQSLKVGGFLRPWCCFYSYASGHHQKQLGCSKAVLSLQASFNIKASM